jgi:hypothetical protein
MNLLIVQTEKFFKGLPFFTVETVGLIAVLKIDDAGAGAGALMLLAQFLGELGKILEETL